MDCSSPKLNQGMHSKSLCSSCGQGRADLGVTRLQYVINEITALTVRQKGALHRVDGNNLEILKRQTKSLRGRLEFLRHRCVAHQAIVGVQRNAKFLLIKNLERMLGQALRGTGLHVAEQTNLQ